jgi:ADP-ribosylglycohydrolase
MWGLVAGVVASLIQLPLAVKQIAAITHAHEELFEGSVMLIASGMLSLRCLLQSQRKTTC